MITGFATGEGTARYRARSTRPEGYWRPFLGLTVSSIGMGSYLGAWNEAADRAYAATLGRAVELGCNLIDTAINYRFQRSERSLGAGLAEAIRAGTLRRDEVVLCTKGGFVSFDGAPPRSRTGWFEETFVRTGIARSEDLVAECHCMTPAYLRHQIEASRTNLGVETIDVYYLHNPETQLAADVPAEEVYARIAAAFDVLEAAIREGKIRAYGTATWDGFRKPAGGLSLARLAAIAEQVGGPRHGFRAIQAPYNPAMPEAFSAGTQESAGRRIPLLEAARAYGIATVTSVPLLQTRLLGALTDDVRARLPGFATDAQRCLQFARSTPGVTAPVVGMSRVAHAEENLATAQVAPLTPAEFHSRFPVL